MRRTSILGLVLLLVVIIAVPASAKQGDVTKTNETYSIPQDLGLIDDLGELNHGCGGLYTLVDGTFKKKATTTYFPSEEAWLAGETGATMTNSGTNKYVGLWDNDEQLGALFNLDDDNIRYTFASGTDGSEWGSLKWSGSFTNVVTGEVTAWWNFDVSWENGVEVGIVEGTC